MSSKTKDWADELLSKTNDGDDVGFRKMLEDELASSPFHPDRSDTDDAGKIHFYQGSKEVFKHPDGTFHDAPFQG